MRKLSWLGLSFLLGCGGGGGDGKADAGAPDAALPARVCKTPGAPEVKFRKATAELGLAATADFKPLATTVRAADLDGDEYPDVISTVGVGTRDTATARFKFVLMNRPDPNDATKRILVDATAASGLLATTDGVGGRGFGSVNLGDIDNDGDLDALLCSPDPAAPDGTVFMLNNGHGVFAQAPDPQPMAAGRWTCHTATLLDYDRDGILDLWPGTYGTKPLLFHGFGDGAFENVAAAMGLPDRPGTPQTHQSYRRNFGVSACDLDGDGDQDVLLADYGREANQVWRNDGDRFTEIGQQIGVAFDDRMDYTTDESYRCFCEANVGMCPTTVPPSSGMIQCPIRGWVAGESDQPWRLGGNNFSLTCGDIDDDGDMDLMSATIRHADVGTAADPSELIINDTPAGQPLTKFRRPGVVASGLDRPQTGLFWNLGDMMPVFADLDGDGRKDIYLTSSDYPDDHGWVWRQKDDGTFADVTVASGAGHAQIHGVALVDLDLDGDLDLLAGTSTARSVAPTQALEGYINEGGAAQNWTRIRLVGRGQGGANRSAIGARVAVTAGGRTQVQEVSGGGGHGSMQHDVVLTFGLGAACDIDKIEVRWPDAAATRTEYTGVRANYRLVITQGAEGSEGSGLTYPTTP